MLEGSPSGRCHRAIQTVASRRLAAERPRRRRCLEPLDEPIDGCSECGLLVTNRVGEDRQPFGKRRVHISTLFETLDDRVVSPRPRHVRSLSSAPLSWASINSSTAMRRRKSGSTNRSRMIPSLPTMKVAGIGKVQVSLPCNRAKIGRMRTTGAQDPAPARRPGSVTARSRCPYP